MSGEESSPSKLRRLESPEARQIHLQEIRDPLERQFEEERLLEGARRFEELWKTLELVREPEEEGGGHSLDIKRKEKERLTENNLAANDQGGDKAIHQT